jgi:hypothetical protein
MKNLDKIRQLLLEERNGKYIEAVSFKLELKYNIKFPTEPTEKDYIAHSRKEAGYKTDRYCYHNMAFVASDWRVACRRILEKAREKKYPRIYKLLNS